MCTTRTTPEQGVQPERSGGWENNTGCERSSRHCYERSEGRLRLRPGQTTPPHRGGGGTQGDERSEEINHERSECEGALATECNDSSGGVAFEERENTAERMSLLGVACDEGANTATSEARRTGVHACVHTGAKPHERSEVSEQSHRRWDRVGSARYRGDGGLRWNLRWLAACHPSGRLPGREAVLPLCGTKGAVPGSGYSVAKQGRVGAIERSGEEVAKLVHRRCLWHGCWRTGDGCMPCMPHF